MIKLDYQKQTIFLSEQIRRRSCHKEPGTVRWIEGFSKGDSVFDVGCNVGTYSLVMSLYVRKVFAFEPAVTNFSPLLKNIEINRQNGVGGNIVPLNIALAESSRIDVLNYTIMKPGWSGHQIARTVDGFGRQFKPAFSHPAICMSVDDFINVFNVVEPNHIKIDTDGNELDVLLGAEGVLSGPELRSILVEIDDEGGRKSDIVTLLRGKGFRVNAKHRLLARCKFYNYLFTKEKE